MTSRLSLPRVWSIRQRLRRTFRYIEKKFRTTTSIALTRELCSTGCKFIITNHWDEVIDKTRFEDRNSPKQELEEEIRVSARFRRTHFSLSNYAVAGFLYCQANL